MVYCRWPPMPGVMGKYALNGDQSWRGTKGKHNLKGCNRAWKLGDSDVPDHYATGAMYANVMDEDMMGSWEALFA